MSHTLSPQPDQYTLRNYYMGTIKQNKIYLEFVLNFIENILVDFFIPAFLINYASFIVYRISLS